MTTSHLNSPGADDDGPSAGADADASPAAPETPPGGPEGGAPEHASVGTDAEPVRAQPQPVLSPTEATSDDESAWLIELPEFEGPLDLLLHLVRRHELEILDIPISFVCEKYLEYLDFMRALDLEVAGEYLVMAATLAYLKSRELIPTTQAEAAEGEGESGEEGPDPREELIARLLEYQKYRAAAEELDALPVSGRDVFDRGGAVELSAGDPGLAPVTLFRLAEAFQRVLERARIHKSHEVVLETVSVSQRMEQLTDILIERPKVEFEWLFLNQEWPSEAYLRSMLVVTLMSLLELTRMGIIHVHQLPEEETITIERVASPEEAKRALSGFDERLAFGRPEEPETPEPSAPDEEDGEVAEEADEGGGGDDASLLAAIQRSLEAMERRAAGTDDESAAFGVEPDEGDDASWQEPDDEAAAGDPQEASASGTAPEGEPLETSAPESQAAGAPDKRPDASPPQPSEESRPDDDSPLASTGDSSDALPRSGPGDDEEVSVTSPVAPRAEPGDDASESDEHG